jgi:hypothetical protein
MSRPRLAPASRVPARVPPEDVGGFGGHERFLAIMADRDDPEHADMKQWCGGHFDPGWFDLTRTDKNVKNALKANVADVSTNRKPGGYPGIVINAVDVDSSHPT